MPRVDGRTLPAPPSAALYDYFEQALQSGLRYEMSPGIAESAQMTRHLSNVERATARITVGPPTAGAGPMHEAAVRLRVLDARGLLSRLSAHTVAQTLQSVLHSAHPNALRYAARGWLTLELCDRFDLIQVWLSTPDPEHARRFRRMRLRDRMSEIRNVHNR